MIRLFAITCAGEFPDFVAQSRALCERAREGALAIVLREYRASGRKQYEWARALREVTARSGQMLFIADRIDLAQLVGADGVHLPSGGLSPSQVPPDSGFQISRSGHLLERLCHEDWRRLSAVWVSPACAPRKGRAALGEEGLRQKIEWLKGRAPNVPVYALGGVTSKSVPGCRRAGATGVAAIGAAWGKRNAQDLLQSLNIER